MDELVDRLAMALCAVFLVAAAAVAFLPAGSDVGDGDCGRWFAPEASADDIPGLLEDRAYLEGGVTGAGVDEVDRMIAYAADCEGKLDARRTWSIGLFIAAVVLPSLVWFVGAPLARRRETAQRE